MKKNKGVSKNFQCYCGKYIPNESFDQYQGKDRIRLEVCKDLPFFGTIDGNDYCILHYPSSEKPEIENIIKQRVENKEYNFGGVWFTAQVNFHEFKFEKEPEARFDYAHFSFKTDFWYSEFPEKVFFDFALFENEALFSFARFEIASFHQVEFLGEAIFYNTRFNELGLFSSCKFQKNVSFGFSKFKNAFFKECEFLGEKGVKLNFFDAEFRETAMFNEVIFPSITNFSGSIFFEDTLFTSAQFKKVNFDSVLFKEEVYFSFSTFQEEVSFDKTKFKKDADFTKTKFFDQVLFLGNPFNKVFLADRTVSFDDIFVENPELVLFHTVTLRPNWFMNTDTRNFVFDDVDWENADGKKNTVKIELNAIIDREIVGRPHRLFTITCRQLAENAENSDYYEQSSNFRRMAMELIFFEKWLALKTWLVYPIVLFNIYGETKLRYKERWKKVYKKWKQKHRNSISFWRSIDPIHYLYRWLSSYGESWIRAFLVLFVLIFFIFPLIFTLLDFQTCPKEKPLTMSITECERDKENCKCRISGLNYVEATAHSLSTATLQNVEYRKPVSFWSETLMKIE